MKKIKTGGEMILVFVFVVLCAFVTALNASDNPFHIGNTGLDSSVFHYVAQVILRGGMPYRDTFDHKGPLIYLIDALGMIINQQIGVWLIELVFVLITFVFAFKIARLLGCGHLSSCITVAANVLTLSIFLMAGIW